MSSPVDPTNANTALASAFVEELARGGLRHAVVSPGSRSTPLAVALWREPEIEVTVIVDERSAAFFALGAAQASGDAGGAALHLRAPRSPTTTRRSARPTNRRCRWSCSSADRPPELRGIGAGQTIDQIKLFGSSVRWFCEVGTHEADDDGLLHYRSVACRALAAARGETRPGPVHLNLPWREPLAPVPVEGAVTATDPLALEGRDGRPLTAVTRIDLEPSAFLLDEIAGHIGDAISGVIVAGRQLDPELREPLAHLARVSGFPILAEPTSQLRCGPHDRSHVVAAYDLLLRDERFARSVVPDLVLRFGEMPTSKPLRAWLAASGASEIVDRPLRRLERADEPRGGDPARRPDRAGLGLGGAAGERRAASAGAESAGSRPRRAAQAALERGLRTTGPARSPSRPCTAPSAPPTATATSSTPPRACRSATRRPSSPPSDTDALFLCNRGANGIDGLISSGIGAAHASGRPTTIVTGDLGLLHDIGGLAALRDVSTPVRIVVIDNDGGGIFHFLPQEQALASEEFEALLGTPRGVDAAKAAALFDLPHRRLESLAELPDALAAGTGLIEVKTDRTDQRRAAPQPAAQVRGAPSASSPDRAWLSRAGTRAASAAP